MSIFQLLKRHFNKNKSIVFIFLACQICSVFAFCFVFLYVSSIQSYNSSEQSISIEPSDTYTKEIIINYTEDLYQSYSENIDCIWFQSYYNQIPVKVYLHYNKENPLHLSAGNFFDKAPATQLPPCIIQLSQNYADFSVGDSIEIFGYPHEIIGFTSTSEWEVNHRSIEYISTLSDIQIVFSKSASSKTKKNCILNVREKFPGSKIEISDNKLEFWDCIGSLECFLFFLIILLININFFGLFQYIIKEDLPVMRVFYILGCSTLKAISQILKEILVICAISSAIGIVLFQTVIAKIIHLLNSNFVSYLPLEDVAVLWVLYFLSIILLFIPMICIKYRKQIFPSGKVVR